MFGSVGLPELVVVAVISVLAIWPAWRICRKTGYSGVLGVGLCVPLVNLVVWLFLAFARWPIERELEQLKATRGSI